MKKVYHRNSVSRIFGFALAFLLTFSTALFAQEGDVAAGKSLFNLNCAACHNPYKDMTGPALNGVTSKYEREWLYKWINNNAALIASGDADAIAASEWSPTAMNAFPLLTTTEMDNILAYVEQPKPEPVVAAAPAGGGAVTGGSGISNELILGALVLIFGLLVMMLFLVNKTLRRIAEANGVEIEEEAEKRLPLWKAFVQNQFLVLVSTIFLLLAGAYFAYGYLMQIGVDQGYEPVQPIHYSHRIHAGENKIECKYCHSSARVSKHSGIPALNVCMNCHKYIGEVAAETLAEGQQEYGIDYNAEIQKLYKAVGWDGQQYTGESQPVKWVRIHNLPDFVYFNHSQHVEVAEVECQTCHGPVEEMEIMYQYSSLTMGWCINCHRETNIKVEGNEYYAKIHAELSKKYGVEKLTAAEMGGLECGKCHY
ncbi:c-type cytochrome [Sungkyunkwania multivorans]|uniref:C-type cytochrome n=1 Tax=Sungkyunkwania multivorans TaxID=1173618 RepID=A0ABW3CTE2_9FLAO